MRAMEYLDQHQVLLHTRQQAARRDGIIFLALLIIILLFPWLLVTRTGYQPGTGIVILLAFVALSNAIHTATKLAEYRMLGELIEALDVLQRVLEQSRPGPTPHVS